MIAMQYTIALPADYDMAIIRRRIADKGHLLDDFPGLAFKAWLHAARDDNELPSRDNLYAPFYLWRDSAGMNASSVAPASPPCRTTSGVLWCAAGYRGRRNWPATCAVPPAPRARSRHYPRMRTWRSGSAGRPGPCEPPWPTVRLPR